MNRLIWVLAPIAMALLLGACAEGLETAPEPLQLERSPAVPTSGIFEGVPGAGVEFTDYPAQTNLTNAGWSPLMTDVVQHLPASYGNTYYDSDKITYCHEQSHGIHSHLRNEIYGGDQRVNGFYVPGNKAVFVVEPGIRKSRATGYVPRSLQGSRFDLYIAGSQSWDDTPLYIWDEWNAYANGSACGVDLAQRGLWTAGWRDGVAGTLEFVVYGIALAMAVRDHDPEYWQANTQFREFLAYNIRRSMEAYRAGAVMEEFRWDRQDAYYESLRTAPDAEPIRQFARDTFGPMWADSVLFGDGVVPDDDVVDPDDDIDVEPDPDDNDINPDDNDINPDDNDINPDDNDINPDDNDINPDDNVLPEDDQDPELGGEEDLPDPNEDGDDDGIRNGLDLCSATPRGERVWDVGKWIGCAGGEYRDRLPPTDGPDADSDGIDDAQDRCSRTPRGRLVWSTGEWIGCAGGEYRD